MNFLTELTLNEQEKLVGGGATYTTYVRYNDGFKGGDGTFKQTGGLDNSFDEAGKVVGTYDSGDGTTASFEGNGESKTKNNGPDVESDDTFTGDASRLGSESTVMQIKFYGKDGQKYRLL